MEKKKKPAIRFKGFTDSWEQRKLGDEAEEILAGGDIDKEKAVDDGVYPIYANALTNDGIVGYYDDYYRVKAPAVTVTGRGEVGHAQARIVDFTPVVRLLAIRSNHDCYFLENAINNHKVIVESTGVPQLTVPQLSSYDFCFPKDIMEEKKIGTYFNQLDHLITLHQRKYDKLQIIKKAMLEKMFPQNGSCFPEIRFKGFTDSWEQRKVGDFLTESRVRGNTGLDAKKLTVKLWGKGVVEKNDFGGSEHTQYFTRRKGQFIYSKLDFLNSAFGVIPEKLDNYESTADLPAFDLDGMNPYFMYFVAIQESFYLKHGSIADGSRKAKRIHADTFLNMPVMVPTIDEQNLIVDFLQHLDHLITLHQREVEKLQNIKKSMLETMFV